MNINSRLDQLEAQLQAMTDDAQRVDAIREFRRVNPDADYLLGRLAAIGKTNNPARFFADVFGVPYDGELTWAQNVDRANPPPGTIPGETFEALKAIGSMAEFLGMFRQEPANASTLDAAIAATRTSDPIEIIGHGAGAGVRHAFGAFCRHQRIQFPGSNLIRARVGRNVVTVNEGALLHFFAETEVNNQTAGVSGKDHQ